MGLKGLLQGRVGERTSWRNLAINVLCCLAKVAFIRRGARGGAHAAEHLALTAAAAAGGIPPDAQEALDLLAEAVRINGAKRGAQVPVTIELHKEWIHQARRAAPQHSAL